MPIDLLALFVLLFCLIHGWIRGIVVQVFKVAALVCVWLFGFHFALPLAGWMHKLVGQEGVALVIAYAIVTLVALIAFSIVGELVNGLFNRTHTLGKINRTFGAAMGLVKGLIVVWLSMMALSLVPEGADQFRLGTLRYWRSRSKLYDVIMDVPLSPKLPAVRVETALTELRKLVTGKTDPAIRTLDVYQRATADMTLRPFLADKELQARIDRLLSEGKLIQLFELPEVQKLLRRPDKQALLWEVIDRWKAHNRREAERMVLEVQIDEPGYPDYSAYILCLRFNAFPGTDAKEATRYTVHRSSTGRRINASANPLHLQGDRVACRRCRRVGGHRRVTSEIREVMKRPFDGRAGSSRPAIPSQCEGFACRGFS